MSEEFATMFERKIKDMITSTSINANVYNGTRKINEQEKNFMSSTNIRTAILSLKLKNSEGYDRIPQKLLL